ncbi:MAG: hypothetical protein ACFFBP_13570 [Promethearchaeota archaeon]
MKLKKISCIFGLISLFCLTMLSGIFNIENLSEYSYVSEYQNEILTPSISVGTNEDIIDEILDAKIGFFQAEQFFPGLYETSIHATYYAIYTIFTLGKSNMLNENTIIDFIMAHYNNSTALFEDSYSDRYLDTDFNQWYFPLTTLLEVNCYAFLTLDLLDAMDRIDTQDAIDFIWSCYNPVTSGFIGQPYDASLEEKFKVSTLDNTYHAIYTLDLLMDDWTVYSQEEDELVAFINSLQNLDGSIDNDLDNLFDSLQIWEPNPISAWYAVKVLELFNQVDTINLANLRTYLEELYDIGRGCFKLSTISGYEQHSDVISSALCMEISDIVLFANYDRAATIQFIQNNRNSLGNWNEGTLYDYHELLYTYFIIRAFDNTGSLPNLSPVEVDEIASSTSYYYDGIGGYAILSKDYTPIKSLYSVINSLMIEDKYDDLNLSEKEALFTSIISGYQESPFGKSAFFYNIKAYNQFIGFMTSPLDCFSAGSKERLKVIEYGTTHKNTYLTLEMLDRMFKLDDLDTMHDLTRFIDNVIASHFMEIGYDETGGFYINDGIQAQPASLRVNFIYFEHSYYAIKILELLTEFLGIGDVHDVGIDHDAFIAYIYRNIQQFGDILWFQPKYTDDVDIILKNIYFAIDALQILDAFNLDVQKIYNFIYQNIDYTNIRNVYYCHKIINALSLDNFINYDMVKTLISLLYDESTHELYLTTKRNNICQEALWWVCEMANSGIIKAELSVTDPVPLGTSVNVSVTLKNLIYNVSTQYYLVNFESNQLGTFQLQDHSSCYWDEIFIPIYPSNYPWIIGNISIYKSGLKQLEVPLVINTTYETYEEFDIKKLADGSIVFDGLSQLIINDDTFPAGLYGFRVRVDVYFNDGFTESLYMESSDTQFSDRTEYYLKYTPQSYGKYYFEMYYENPIEQNAIMINSESLSYSGSSGVFQGPDNALTGAIIIGVALALSSTGVMVFSTKKRGVLHRKFNR